MGKGQVRDSNKFNKKSKPIKKNISKKEFDKLQRKK